MYLLSSTFITKRYRVYVQGIKTIPKPQEFYLVGTAPPGVLKFQDPPFPKDFIL